MQQSHASFSALNWVLRVALYQIEQKYAGTGARNHYEINNECTDREQRAENANHDNHLCRRYFTTHTVARAVGRHDEQSV